MKLKLYTVAPLDVYILTKIWLFSEIFVGIANHFPESDPICSLPSYFRCIVFDIGIQNP